LKPLVPFLYNMYMMKNYLRKVDTWFFCSTTSNMIMPWVFMTGLISLMNVLIG